MGVVYLAEEPALRRRVALKVLPAHVTLQTSAVERFRREASIAARLRHPGIVEVHTIGEDSGTHFFAMEFVEGVALDRLVVELRSRTPSRLEGDSFRVVVAEAVARERAKTRGAEDASRSRDAPSAWSTSYIETVCLLVARVADALHHAHLAGVIHRDVKPSN